jgi:DNA-binding NarL/FixJ family response regulator
MRAPHDPAQTRILIADDHPIVLRGLRIVLHAQPDLEVIAEATDGDQAVKEDPRHLDAPENRPPGRARDQYLFEAISAGASGYVLKSAVDRDLVEACRAIMRGEPFLYPDGIRALMREYMERARTGETHRELLTPREEEILKLVAEAHTNDEIAELLHISKKTVERHRANVLEKLGMRDCVQLTRYAIRRGLICLSRWAADPHRMQPRVDGVGPLVARA